MDQKIRVAIYDLDGTILNSGREGFRRLGVLAEKNNLPFTEDVQKRLEKHWGLPPIKLIAAGFDASEEIAEGMYKQWVALDETEPIPLVTGVKKRLSENLKNGIVNFMFTSRHTESAFNVSKKFNIAYLFEDVVGLEGGACLDDDNEPLIKPTGLEKPDPHALDNLLAFIEEYYGFTKEEIAYVGDEIFDIQCGMNAGLRTYGVTSGLKTADDLISAGALPEMIFPTVTHIKF